MVGDSMICPLLRVCKANVDLEHYQKICSNLREDAYKKCEHFQKLAGGKKTPLEWQSLITPISIGTPTPTSEETYSPATTATPPRRRS